MEKIQYNRTSLNLITLFSMFVFFIAGCSNNAKVDLKMFTLDNPDVAALDAEDIVTILIRAGFSDEQIIQYGTDLRNKLSSSGAAQIHIKEKVEAILAVNSDCVYVSSRARGNFIYNYKEKGFLQN